MFIFKLQSINIEKSLTLSLSQVLVDDDEQNLFCLNGSLHLLESISSMAKGSKL